MALIQVEVFLNWQESLKPAVRQSLELESLAKNRLEIIYNEQRRY